MCNENIMLNSNPLLSVCIPAYNRPTFITDLLNTIVSQDFNNFEVVVSEDNSPKSKEIETIVERIARENSHIPFQFSRNEETLGYDGNFRKLIELSKGDYCVYMGDDDLLNEGALTRIAKVIENHQGLGVILRSWARADRKTKEILEVFRYFDGDRLFAPGADGIVTFFRRSVAIAGYTVNRKMAKKFATNQFDGTLLYQLYLSGMILAENPGYYIEDLIAIMRKDADQSPTHFFGSAKVEKKRFTPGRLETHNSINFIDGMLEIAMQLETKLEIKGLHNRILSDLGCYSYPLLSVQSNQNKIDFMGYYKQLFSKGLWRSPYFHVYFLLLFIFGKKTCEKLIISIKNHLKRTPLLGSINPGKRVKVG